MTVSGHDHRAKASVAVLERRLTEVTGLGFSIVTDAAGIAIAPGIVIAAEINALAKIMRMT